MNYKTKYTDLKTSCKKITGERSVASNIGILIFRWLIFLVLALCFLAVIKFFVVPCLSHKIFSDSIFIVSGGSEC